MPSAVASVPASATRATCLAALLLCAAGTGSADLSPDTTSSLSWCIPSGTADTPCQLEGDAGASCVEGSPSACICGPGFAWRNVQGVALRRCLPITSQAPLLRAVVFLQWSSAADNVTCGEALLSDFRRASAASNATVGAAQVLCGSASSLWVELLQVPDAWAVLAAGNASSVVSFYSTQAAELGLEVLTPDVLSNASSHVTFGEDACGSSSASVAAQSVAGGACHAVACSNGEAPAANAEGVLVCGGGGSDGISDDALTGIILGSVALVGAVVVTFMETRVGA